MDRNSYGLEGADNAKNTKVLKMYFEKHPQYQPQPSRRFEPHYIDTTQQPEDHSDMLGSWGGLFGTWTGLVLGAAALVLGAAALVLAGLHFGYGSPL